MTSIGFSSGVSQSLNSFRTLNKRQQDNSQKLATGKKINSGKDDPVALSQISKLNSTIRALSTANDSISTSSSTLGVAESGLQSQLSSLQQAREYVMQASNDLLSPSERGSIENAYNSVASEVDRVGASSSFGGTSLLDGSFGTQTIQTGANEGDSTTVSLSASNTTSLGLSGVDLSTASSAGSALTSIDAAIDAVTGQMQAIGLDQQRLDNIAQSNANTNIVLEEARSEKEDLDVGRAMAEQSKLAISRQAGLYALSASIDSDKQMLSLFA